MTTRLGCIADDFTGATDLAGNLVARGIPATVVIGAQSLTAPIDAGSAVVVALKTRTAPAGEAVEQSLTATRLLRGLGADRIYIKYCSTFDSTARGNIGPVVDAVMAELGADRTVLVPSFPQAGRTVEGGVLHVHGVPLAESSMRDHPLTPMRESDVAALFAAQSDTSVSTIDLAVVRRGAEALRAALADAPGRAVVIDAVVDGDLRVIHEATSDLPVVTGASGLALGMTGDAPASSASDAPSGPLAIVCGSASAQSRRQIAHARDAGVPVRKIDPSRGVEQVAEIVRWAEDAWRATPGLPVLVCATETTDDLEPQPGEDRAETAERVEAVLAESMRRFVASGARRLIAAGGETSGRVVYELGITQLELTRPIAPGVSWAAATAAASVPVWIALKSGNFGSDDFFTTAGGLLS